jgi:transcriptional regulator with XRE-family HTH domain
MLPERQIKYLYESLGATIKKLRKEKGYKQTYFAELLKISRASLVNIEHGRQRPPLHNLYEMSIVLNIHINDLLPILNNDKEIHKDIEKQIELESGGNLDIKEKLTEFTNIV